MNLRQKVLTLCDHCIAWIRRRWPGATLGFETKRRHITKTPSAPFRIHQEALHGARPLLLNRWDSEASSATTAAQLRTQPPCSRTRPNSPQGRLQRPLSPNKEVCPQIWRSAHPSFLLSASGNASVMYIHTYLRCMLAGAWEGWGGESHSLAVPTENR